MVSTPTRDSLPWRWLPKFDFVALWVNDPPELSVFGVVCLLENVAALAAQSLQEAVQVRNSIVDLTMKDDVPGAK